MARDALRRAYAEHRLALVRLATLLTRDEGIAEDLVHDVFLRSSDRLQDLGDAERYSYLRRGILNAWKNYRRHVSVEAKWRAGLSSAADADRSPDVIDRQTIWPAIARLPDRQRAVIVLRYYEDLPDAEIAQLLGCAEVTVRTQARRALFKLRGVVQR